MVRYLAYAAAALILVGAMVWFFRPAQYEAYALLKVARSPQGVLDKSREDRETFDIFRRTQAALMTSGPVLRNTVRDPRIAALSVISAHGDPVAWLENQIVVEFPNDAELMRVAIHTNRPDEATQLIDAVVNKYLREVVMKDRDERFQQEDDLQKRYDAIVQVFKTKSRTLFDLEQSIQSQETAAGELRRKLAIADLDDAISTRNYLRRELLDNELQMNMQRTQRAAAAEAETAQVEAGENPPVAAPDAPAPSEKVVQSLEQQRQFLVEKLQEVDEHILRIGKEFAQVRDFDATVAAQREELAALNQLMKQIKSQIDLTEVERMAQERVMKVDDATAVPFQADHRRRIAVLAASSLISLGLVVVGWAAGRRKRFATGQ